MKIRKDLSLGANLRKYRNASKLTQEQVCAKLQILGCDVSRGAYAQMETGIISIPVSVLLALSEIFEVEVGAFFEGLSIH